MKISDIYTFQYTWVNSVKNNCLLVTVTWRYYYTTDCSDFNATRQLSHIEAAPIIERLI